MGIPVKLEIFEGPLDLLLHLIEKNKIDIYDIPIVLITEQYMEYVAQLSASQLDVMSEFLVMAATLLRIKSRMLLPQNEEDEEDEDPRQELVERLLEYKIYKYMSGELREREQQAAGLAFRKKELPEEILAKKEKPELSELLSDLTLKKLKDVFDAVMKRQEDKVDPIRSRFHKIEKELVSLPDKIIFIRAYAMEHREFYFKRLLMTGSSKIEIVVTFLGVLELMKSGNLVISQEYLFDDILIRYKEAGNEGK